MTLPCERYRAILNARRFLRSLLDPKATPKVPRDVRMEAYYVLKHFPGEWDMFQVSQACPTIFECLKEDREEYDQD